MKKILIIDDDKKLTDLLEEFLGENKFKTKSIHESVNALDEFDAFSPDLIILDMGTGLRNLGNYILNDTSCKKEINILLSHYHWDHIMGFFYFAPLYNKDYTINIYGYNSSTPILEVSEMLTNKSFWPVDKDMYKANINFIELSKSNNELQK